AIGRGGLVADRRRVGDFAAESAEISDLPRPNPPNQFVQARIKLCQLRLGVLVGDRRAEPQSIAAVRYPRKLLDLAEVDQSIGTSMLLGDEEADIRCAGNERRLGVAPQQPRQFIDGPWRDVAPAAARDVDA